jgi:hypothetical protein
MQRAALPLAATAALALSAASAAANQINTADASGAYHASFCPRLETQLRQASFSYACQTSAGTGANLRRVATDARQIGYGQLDVLAVEGALAPGSPITILRNDDIRECLFAVTRNKDVRAWGDIAVGAPRLRFILPPSESGSAGTFRYLRQIDPDGIGRAVDVAYAETTDAAIRQALSADDTVSLFVQVPDPDNVRFRLVGELGGHFVPVIDRAILRPQVNWQKIYFAQETQVANANWTSGGITVVTACTPLVVFTGTPERVAGDKSRQDHQDLIATVRALRPELLLPQETAFARFLKRTKELSAGSAERLLNLSEEARTQAGPLIERAKEASDKAIEAAKPTLEKAKEIGQQVLERAKEEARELMDRNNSEPKK